MISRVTHQTVQKSTLANLQMNLDRMSRLQAQMSGGKVITRPSDDPGGTAAVLQLRSDKRAAEQHSRNIDNGLGWLGSIDSALTTSLASLRRARDLTVQGANGANSAQAREAIAIELEGIRDAMLSEANTTHLGRSVFAGTSDAGMAFTGPDGTPPYAWTGATSSSVERRITPDTTVRVDVDGAAAYGQGAESVFALIDSIVTGLRTGGDVAPLLNGLDDRMKAMLGELGSVGTRYGQLETAQQANQKTLMDLKSQISGIEDIDLAEVIVELQSQEVAYQAALGATARVLQPSLLDFLR
ncbi:flagellar hook-associated protein FlgL [Cellulomonas bogoriensis]|uniref:Flagellar hook-associated protein 3 n=1 Tax=Cellulomonas bogoriensis 69B4 = DSM 16987 TaxID=1386082 RepID=A0A0A0BYQ5_9CELL|nr:flagellar hook-associated protein FlgL [Cellulomonas bogoriensis]KGM13066.1 flagellar hook-associated protein 3 [Cellulomonas bogoriensis 69B4 = DSM 16987]